MMSNVAVKPKKFFSNPVAGSLVLAVSVASPSLAYQNRHYLTSVESGQTNPWYRPAEPEQADRHVGMVQIVTEMKLNGFPVASIAHFAGVERKTVYSWLDGESVPQSDREDRVADVYPILKRRFGGDFALMHRVWRSKTRDGVSLESIFADAKVDVAAVETQLEFLNSSIERLRASDAFRKAKPFKNASGKNGFVEESTVADFQRI